jgi:hypothetical protein
MVCFAVLFHPSNIPHSDTLGVPTWLQWSVLAIALAIGGWLVFEARADRRGRAGQEVPTTSDATDRPATERLVRRTSTARPRPVPADAAPEVPLNPPGVLVLVIGFVAGWFALDRVRAVDVLAGFIRTNGVDRAVRLGFCFAALLWVGAALAPVAARGAALAFGSAGVIGIFLATPSRWERRLEWWGAGAVLNSWDHRPYWAAGAFALAVLALAAGRYRRGGRHGACGTVAATGRFDRLTPG